MNKYALTISAAALTTIIFITAYIAGQYILRVSANDPQIQLAFSSASSLNNNAAPSTIVSGKVDPSLSSEPFIMIYDEKGILIASPAYIGQVPLKGVALSELKGAVSGHKAFTWQPEPYIRLAAVAVKAKGYYVVVSRSLRDIENRMGVLARTFALGWLASMLAIAALHHFFNKTLL